MKHTFIVGRVFLFAMALFSLVTFGVVFQGHKKEKKQLLQQIEDGLEREAEMIKASLGQEVDFQSRSFLRLQGQKVELRVKIVSNGASSQALNENLNLQEALKQKIHRPLLLKTYQTDSKSYYLSYLYPLSSNRVVTLSIKEKAIQALSPKMSQNTGLLIVSVLCVSFLLYSFLFWLFRPLSTLLNQAEKLANRESAKREMKAHSITEFQKLGAYLNQISDLIERNSNKYRARKNEQGAILASMREGVIAVTEELKVAHINEAASEMLKLSVDGAKRAPLYELIRIPQLQEFIKRSLSIQNSAQEEIVLDEGMKTMKVLSVRCTPLLEDDGLRKKGAVFVMSDVTEIRSLEGMRKDFVANVSHELRTPLTTIKGFAETILELSKQEVGEVALKFTEIIYRHANRLEILIEDLMTLSKLDKGGLAETTDFTDRKVNSIVQAAVEFCQPKARKKNIEIQFLQSGEMTVQASPTLLEQAFVNLVDNAVKYTPEGGVVKVSISEVLGDVSVSVKDTGIGIAPEHIPHLFERFYRVDKGRSRNMGGTGLGLAIVKNIVQAHGGEISVKSEVGYGSDFLLRIPQISNENQTNKA